MVEPPDPLERCHLHLFESTQQSFRANNFCLVKTNDRFGEAHFAFADTSLSDGSILAPFSIAGFGNDVWVLDQSAKKLTRYDRELRPVFIVGREGQGPGEFVDPWSVDVTAAGEALVVDPPNRRASIFDSSGRFVVGIQLQVIPPNRSAFAASNGSIMVAAAKLDGPLVEVRDRSGTVIDTFGTATPFENPPFNGPSQAATSILNPVVVREDESGRRHVIYSNQPRYARYTADDLLEADVELNSPMIDTVRVRGRSSVDAFQKTNKNPMSVSYTSYFSDFALLPDGRLLIVVDRKPCLILFDPKSGSLTELRENAPADPPLYTTTIAVVGPHRAIGVNRYRGEVLEISFPEALW